MTDRAALAALTAEIVACRRCPRLVEWREQVAREKVARFRDETYWGRPLPGLRRPGRADPAARAGAGGPRRQPDGPGVHRRRVGRLPVGGAARGRASPTGRLEPARRRRPDADRRLHRGGRPLRAAGQQADARRSATPARRSSSARSALLDRVCVVVVALGAVRLGRGAPGVRGAGPRDARREPRFGHGAEARDRAVPAARLVPPEPAEHVHRPADAADVRRGHPTGHRPRPAEARRRSFQSAEFPR